MGTVSTPRIVIVASPTEAEFARKFSVGTVVVAFNKEYTAFAVDAYTTFVYPNKPLWSNIIALIQDQSINKLMVKPSSAVKGFFKIECSNCQHISEYMTQKGEQRSIPEMKQEIINQDIIGDLAERAGSVSLMLAKYKVLADTAQNQPKKPKKSYFNKRRDCYLLYLTVFNDVLSRYGPLKFIDLVRRIREYPYLCRAGLNPAMALEGLIKVGALSSEVNTTVISIPDQLP